METDQHVLASR